jgi:predicted nucleic acid-binding protein
LSSVYFDSSALVKLFIDEVGSDVAQSLWNGADIAFSSRIAYPEVHAVLAAAHRDHRLDDPDFLAARQVWDELWPEIQELEVTPLIAHRAGDAAARYALGGADAIHLASAEAIGIDSVILSVWDRRLHAGAQQAGFAVAPADVPI